MTTLEEILHNPDFVNFHSTGKDINGMFPKLGLTIKVQAMLGPRLYTY